MHAWHFLSSESNRASVRVLLQAAPEDQWDDDSEWWNQWAEDDQWGDWSKGQASQAGSAASSSWGGELLAMKQAADAIVSVNPAATASGQVANAAAGK
eukprot:2887819-Alexandrium_andersonii.AAC.1